MGAIPPEGNDGTIRNYESFVETKTSLERSIVMSNSVRCTLVILFLSVVGITTAADNSNPFIGRWALTIPGGGAGWLGVAEEGGNLTASILWGGGSVMPTNKAFIDGNTLNIVRLNDVERKDASGKTTRVPVFGEMITAKVSGDEMKLTQIVPSGDGKNTRRSEFHRQTDRPPAGQAGPVEGQVRPADSIVQREEPRRLEADRRQCQERLVGRERRADEQADAGGRQAAHQLRQPPHGGRVRGLQHQAGNQHPQGRQQRRVSAGHLRGAGGRHGRTRAGFAQHGRPLQPDHAARQRRKTRGRVADDGHHAVRSALDGQAQRADAHRQRTASWVAPAALCGRTSSSRARSICRAITRASIIATSC